MNFKVTLILCLALTVCACGTKQKSPQASTPSTQSVPGVETLEPTLEPGTVSDIDIDGIEIPSSPASISVDNLVDRIRNGFAFPDLSTKSVRQHERWASEHPTYLVNLFKRAEPFLYFIVDEIEKRGLPMELALLPAVESAYDPGAVSRSKAAGLWQFVPATGKGFGLRQDWWYDGRHDPYSSTFAALDYLEQLHTMFDGDWFIALAAYNAGPGTLRREIKRAKSKGRKTDYVSLKLRLETRRYVPKLVALKNILLNPHNFDIVLPVVANKPFFDVIKLPGQIDLVEFAKSSKIDQPLLRHLNRGFKRWATPPEGPHRLLVPLKSSSLSAHQSIEKARLVAQNSPVQNYRSHQIKGGDTLSAIARTYGVSVASLRSVNNLKSNNIRAGKRLVIPLPERTLEGAGGTNGSLSKSSSNSNQNANTSSSNGNGSKVKHRVKKGDTLWSISRKYQVKINQLMAWNNLSSNDILSLNQLLTVFLN